MAKLRKDYSQPFINPYNFIPMTQSVKRDSVKGDLFGYLSCKIRVKDKLIIPDANYPVGTEGDDKRTFGFFSVDGKPVIPGSEIRGCIRSVYEAVTPSCFSQVDADETLSAREPFPDNSTKPGILKKEGGAWVIYEAEDRDRVKRHDKSLNGRKADLHRKWPESSEKQKMLDAYFYIVERYGEKQKATVNRTNVPIKCTQKDVEKLIAVLKLYRENTPEECKYDPIKEKKDYDEFIRNRDEKLKVIQEMLADLEAMKKASLREDVSSLQVPIFYRADSDGSLVYISPAHTGRKLLESKIRDYLGDHAPCTGENNQYCPACSLFGTIGNNKPIASRLRFGDATPNHYRLSDDYLIIPELASPRISAVEFYTMRKNSTQTTNVPMWDYDSDGITLRGRKFYLHSPAKTAEVFGARQIKTKAILDESEFTFKLYFDGITEEELKKLLWVLTFGDNDENSKYMHKLGAGKPVGYGSVKIVADEIHLREKTDELTFVDAVKAYKEYADGYGLLETSAADVLKIIANYNYAEKFTVSYPIADNGKGDDNAKASHQWFTQNKVSGNRGVPNTFTDILPPMSEDAADLRLFAYMPGNTGTGGAIPVSGRTSHQGQARGGAGNIAFDFSKFELNKTYAAIITRDVNDSQVDIRVCGERARVLKKFLKPEIAGNIQAAIRNATTIKVIFKGKNEKGYPSFSVVK